MKRSFNEGGSSSSLMYTTLFAACRNIHRAEETKDMPGDMAKEGGVVKVDQDETSRMNSEIFVYNLEAG